MTNKHKIAPSFRYQHFMTMRDWVMVLVLVVVSSVFWTWLWAINVKAAAEASWTIDQVAIGNHAHHQVYPNHAPEL